MTGLVPPLPSAPVVGVGIVVWNDNREIILIRRGKAPRHGEWSIPGGHLELGESLKDAARREVREETGLNVEITALIDVVDSISRDNAGTIDRHFVLVDFAARLLSGELRAGGDALDARWVPYSAIGDYSLWRETIRIIEMSTRP